MKNSAYMRLFEFLRLAAGAEVNADHAPVNPSAEEWRNIYEEAKRQSVLDVVFTVVSKLPKEQLPPKPQMTSLIKRKNLRPISISCRPAQRTIPVQIPRRLRRLNHIRYQAAKPAHIRDKKALLKRYRLRRSMKHIRPMIRRLRMSPIRSFDPRRKNRAV